MDSIKGEVLMKNDFVHVSNPEEETHSISKVEINQDRRSLVNRISVNNIPYGAFGSLHFRGIGIHSIK
jgi:hypothetical protein